MVVRLLVACLALVVAAGTVWGQGKAGGTTLTLTVTDGATSEPIGQADVTIQTQTGRQASKTDENGQIALSVAGQGLSVTVKKEGYVPTSVAWGTGEGSKGTVPEAFTLALDPGTTIGGIVQDEEGKPIAGATVYLLVPTRGEREGTPRPSIWDYPVKTDSAGKWKCNVMPAKLEDIWIRLSHPDFVSDEMYGSTPKPPMEKLRDQTGVMVMKRGLTLAGTVLDAATSKPIAGATIQQGRDRWGSHYPVTKTDGDGKFAFKNTKVGEMVLTVQAKGYAPDAKTFSFDGQTPPVEFKLGPGNKLTGKIVDAKGNPVAGARMVADTWRGMRAIKWESSTNARGEFTWNDAPADEVQFDILKQGYADLRNTKMTAASTQPVVLTMRPPTKVRGTVVDAKTGAPVAEFRVIQGIGWGEGQRVSWQEGRRDRGPGAGKDGKFELTIGFPYPQHLVKVEADGYLPAESRRFTSDEGEVALEFRLEKGEPVSGVVVKPDGTPAVGAEVVLAVQGQNVQIQNGKLAPWVRDQMRVFTADDSGRFTVPPQSGPFVLVAATDAGFAKLAVAKGAASRPASYDLKLQPWARVEGTVRVGSKPGAGEGVVINGAEGRSDPEAPGVMVGGETQAGADGAFRFDRVVPGPVTVQRSIKLSESSTGYSHTTPVVAEAGKTVSVTIGGTGRPVQGRIDIPANLNGGNWAVWHSSVTNHVEMPADPMPEALKKGSDEEKRKWYETFAKSPEGEAYRKAVEEAVRQRNRNYAFAVSKDGTFRIDDVPAGTYDLTAYFQPADAMRSGRWGQSSLGTVQHTFTVPEMAGGRTDEVLDLGTVVFKEAEKEQAKGR